MWNSAVGASLMPLLTLLEVTLRNKVHSAMSSITNNQGDALWFDPLGNNSPRLNTAARTKFDAELLDGNGHRITPARSADKVVSSVSIKAWPDVLQSLKGHIAPRVFPIIFSTYPKATQDDWGANEFRATIVKELYTAVSFRNRVVHQEALWKPHHLGGHQKQTWEKSVAQLRSYVEQEIIHHLVNGMCQDSLKLYKASYAWQWFSRLCNAAAVRHFMNDPTTKRPTLPTWSPKMSVRE